MRKYLRMLGLVVCIPYLYRQAYVGLLCFSNCGQKADTQINITT
jgi:hypothetical protein